MSVEFTHKIIERITVGKLADYVNVLTRVKWQLIANFNGKTAVSEFTHSIPFDQTKPFTPVEQLTDEQIMNWVFDQFHPSDFNAMRAGLAANVQAIK